MPLPFMAAASVEETIAIDSVASAFADPPPTLASFTAHKDDSTTIACRELVRARIAELFPEGRVHVSQEAIDRNSRHDWVTHSLAAQEVQQRKERETQAEKIPDPWLPCMRLELGRSFLRELCGDQGLQITEETVERVASQGWVMRALDAQERDALKAIRLDREESERNSTFHSQIRALPAGGFGDWYECDLPRGPPASEVARVVALAREHPEDLRAQETACRFLQGAASVPLHLDTGVFNSTRIDLVSGDGLVVVIAAMKLHRGVARLQRRACEALWRITDTAASARVAEGAGVVEVLLLAMQDFPDEKALQWAGCAALANIARHREKLSLGPGWHGTIGMAASALANHPSDVGVQGHACALLWHLATEDPVALSKHPGLRHLVQHAATVVGVKQACWLLECVRFRSEAEDHVTRGAGRQRWGQWAAGRRAVA